MMDAFFEPDSARRKVMKWGIILLIILSGIGLFLLNVDDVIAYEECIKSPVYVEATVSVRQEGSLVTKYPMYLSYSYEGKIYERVPYASNQNELNLRNDGKVIMVAINPDNPSQLVSKMVNKTLFTCSVLIMAVGWALLFYGIAVKIDSFHNWRSKAAQRGGSFSGKPDYWKDIFIVFLIILLSLSFILCMIFPNAYGIMHIINSL